MTEEIKEILDYLIDEECTRRIKCITIEESKQLLDYIKNITNLQQENESHKKEMNYYKKQYYNCKSRIDKVLKYLGKCDWNDKCCFENLINILTGGDE